MPDDKSPAAPAGPNAGSIDADAIKNIVSEAIKPYVERIDGQSRVIAKLEGQLKDVKPAEPPKPSTQETELVARVKELEADRKVAQDREKKLKDRTAVNAVRDTFVERGVDPEVATFAAKAWFNENHKSVVVDEDDNGELTPVVVEGDKKSSLKDYASAWLETPVGQKLLPSKHQPQIPSNGNRAPAGKIKYTQADLNSGRFDPAKIRSGEAIVVG